jgi:hypothetical protein
LGGRQHRRQIPFQFDLKPIRPAPGLSPDSATAADVRFQGAFDGTEHDCVDQPADRISGFGPRVGMLEGLRQVGNLLP